jgi:hypothetical protein
MLHLKVHVGQSSDTTESEAYILDGKNRCHSKYQDNQRFRRL